MFKLTVVWFIIILYLWWSIGSHDTAGDTPGDFSRGGPHSFSAEYCYNLPSLIFSFLFCKSSILSRSLFYLLFLSPSLYKFVVNSFFLFILRSSFKAFYFILFFYYFSFYLFLSLLSLLSPLSLLSLSLSLSLFLSLFLPTLYTLSIYISLFLPYIFLFQNVNWSKTICFINTISFLTNYHFFGYCIFISNYVFQGKNEC